MSRPSFAKLLLCMATLAVMLATIPSAWGQHTQGRIDITVLDQKGSLVPGAKLVLKDMATNDERTAETQSAGTYSFVNLPLGKYKLTVSKDGFQTAAYDVTVEATKTTNVEATLQVGAVTQVVEVGAVAPVVDTTTNAIGSVINMKGLENLPITGRNLNQLATLTPGYTGTWNGLPSIALGSNVDGIQQGPTRMKFGGIQVSVQARLESIEEMTIQTDQLDVNQGFGQASMQINFTTRRGSNDFHGRIFEDFRNAALNANSWRNNASGIKKPGFELNDFGGSVGGPILKDKLFFFGTFATSRQPGSRSVSATVLTAAAQSGNFTYASTAASSGPAVCNGTTCTVNLFTTAANYNAANAGANLPTSLNSVIGGQLTQINNSLQFGSVAATTDPIINSLNWLTPAPTSNWYPTVRVDYNTTKNIRMNLAWNRTVTTQPTTNTPYFPGSAFASSAAGNRFNAYTASYGLDWTISPRLVNQFRGGFLYNANYFGYNSPRAFASNPMTVNWANLVTSPQNYYLPVTSYYPVFNASDTLTWQKASHSFNFGFSFYREQDHYWNPPEGIDALALGLVSGDPALTAFTPGGGAGSIVMPGSTTAQQGEAQNLYALLTGRISSDFGRNTYDPTTQTYLHKVTAFNLDELSKAYSLFFQDSWRIHPTFTINYGLRWDFTGAQHDLNGVYHNADLRSLLGPSSNLFQPGTLTGNLNPTIEARPRPYNDWNKAPQPVFGLAWSPHFENGFLQKIAGRDATVIRASFALRKFTVPYQYFWDNASNYGTFFYQFFTLTPNNTGATGTYTPGSLALGQTFPAYAVSPTTYQNSAPESQFTFVGGNGAVGVNGMNQNIAQPYTETWTFGIQRSLGPSRALEIRYNGNRTLKQWISLNLNEVNVFENGFLKEFQSAVSNQTICKANSAACLAAQSAAGITGPNQTTNNFANWGLTGQVALPIMTAAFTGSNTGSQANPNFRGAGTSFLTYLSTGQVGAFAQQLTRLGGTPYFCNLVGIAFAPCTSPTQGNYTPSTPGYPGAGYPINFFQANPYATGNAVGDMEAAGYSSYNSLQLDFRQRAWHGLEFDANYTWSHTLGVSTPNDWTGAYSGFTLRNLRASYGPTLFDLRHVVHVTTTYDLPFGRGKMFANQGGVTDKIVGGWSLGTIMTIQSGFPFLLRGSRSTTFNNIANNGVNLTGVTPEQLQSVIGVYRVPGSNFVTLLPANYLVRPTGGGANPSVFSDNITPGTFNAPIYLYGPHGFYDDIMISKAIPITERWRFTFQAEFLNAFNHPVFGNGTTPIGANILSSSFATTSPGGNFGRQIELRANISF